MSDNAHFVDVVLVMVANRLMVPWSKRRTAIEWLERDVVLSHGVGVPALHQCYRALDIVAEAKEATEAHYYARLTDLINLDLRGIY